MFQLSHTVLLSSRVIERFDFYLRVAPSSSSTSNDFDRNVKERTIILEFFSANHDALPYSLNFHVSLIVD
jgi:hypothetical protein